MRRENPLNHDRIRLDWLERYMENGSEPFIDSSGESARWSFGGTGWHDSLREAIDAAIAEGFTFGEITDEDMEWAKQEIKRRS
jgi:hypothetical protein